MGLGCGCGLGLELGFGLELELGHRRRRPNPKPSQPHLRHGEHNQPPDQPTTQPPNQPSTPARTQAPHQAGEAALAAPWLELAPAEQQDLVARGMALPLVAPPPRALEPEFSAACRAALAPGGVLAFNALGGDAAVVRAAAAVGAGATCAISCVLVSNIE